MDELDRAKIVEEDALMRSIQQIRQAGEGAGTVYCVDCGEKIPDKRKARVPNAIRCVSCQESVEKRQK